MHNLAIILKPLAILAALATPVAFVRGDSTLGWVTLVATLLLAAWVWDRRRALLPIKAFTTAARRIERGQFRSQDSPRQPQPPWDQLTLAFSEMSESLDRREQTLRRGTTNLETVLASMSEGVLAIDGSGKLIMANQAACQMLGLQEAEVMGRKLIEHIRIPELTAAIETAHNDNAPTESEFQTLNQPRRTISASLTPIGSDELAPSTAIVLHDVSSIRQLENMRRDFVANVSHELKTPLSVIKAYAETLKMGAINDQERNLEFVGRIESQADLLERQIQDLLQLARIESQQANLDITVLDLNDLCQDCFHQLAPVAQKRGIQFSIGLTEQPLIVKGDAEAFRAILKNLIANALQYTSAEGTVTIRSQSIAGGVQVEVIDSGIGISPEQQTRIFERFYRADKARSRDMGGTGLGLAIVKHLTTTLGGNVSVESKVGKGSLFRVTFPAAK